MNQVQVNSEFDKKKTRFRCTRFAKKTEVQLEVQGELEMRYTVHVQRTRKNAPQ